MPDYSAPGVYVEETPFRSRSIEGVSTSTAGFIGPTRYGPVDIVPELITSLTEFERIYGNGQRLEFEGRGQSNNYLWHATRAFFNEGGKRLYVGRIFRPLADLSAWGTLEQETIYQSPSESIREDNASKVGELYIDGHSRAWINADAAGQENIKSILIRSRFPGAAGNIVVRITIKLHENLLAGETGTLTAAGLRDHDTVWISGTAAGSEVGGRFYRALFDSQEETWLFAENAIVSGDELRLNVPVSSNFKPLYRTAGDNNCQLRVVTITVSVASADGGTYVWDGIAPDPHPSGDGVRTLRDSFAQNPNNSTKARVVPIAILLGEDMVTGVGVVKTIITGFGSGPKADTDDFDGCNWLNDDVFSIERLLELSGGNDGQLPGALEYVGRASEQDHLASGLAALELVEDVSIVATPGATADYQNYKESANAIVGASVAHAERLRFRIALVDSGDNQTIPEVRAMRGLIDSPCAAFYYPWIRIVDPITETEIELPPSGFVAGIYARVARVDAEGGVAKSPANEAVHGAAGLQLILKKEQQEILNREGINCLRFFEGRGFLVWGARTTSSDPEWKYVSMRRHIAYLERSIEKGLQWAVFEPNGEPLWANVRRAIEDFLLLEWRSGSLVGHKPETAFFVKCDRSTMTQDDLDNGRLVCVVGVAFVKPAEFVIFRIGQWTSSRKDP